MIKYYSALDLECQNFRVIVKDDPNKTFISNVLFADYDNQHCLVQYHKDDGKFSPKVVNLIQPFEIINCLDGRNNSPVENLFGWTNNILLMGGGSSLASDLDYWYASSIYTDVSISINHHAAKYADIVVANDYIIKDILHDSPIDIISQWADISDWYIDCRKHGSWWQGSSMMLAMYLSSHIATENVYLAGFNLYSDLQDKEYDTRCMLAMWKKYLSYCNPNVKFHCCSGPLMEILNNHTGT